MRLEVFAAEYCDGLYNPKFSPHEQAAGWYVLRNMVVNGAYNDSCGGLHENLRELIKEHWDKIKVMTVDRTCLMCKKTLLHDGDFLHDGTRIQHRVGYGSAFDNVVLDFVLCDACIESGDKAVLNNP